MPLPLRMASSVAAYPLLRRRMYVPGLISRSSRRMNAYTLKRRAELMTPACASESAATPNDAPGGTVARTGLPVARPHAFIAIASTKPHHARRHVTVRRPSTLTGERVLQQDGCGQCIDVSFSLSRRTTHLADRSQRGCGRETFIEQLDG